MEPLTETEIAVLREAASAGGYPHQRPRARAARLYALGFIECGAVRWRATHAGHIVLALLDKVSNAEQDRCHLRDFCHVHGHDLARKDGATACCMAGWDLLREENERLKRELGAKRKAENELGAFDVVVATEVLRCALSHAPESRIVGNVTALDLARLAVECIAQRMPSAAEAWANIDRAWRIKRFT